MSRSRLCWMSVGALAALCGSAGVSMGQVQVTSAPPAVTSGSPQRDTLTRLMRNVSNVEFKEHRLEEVVRFIAELTGAEIEPMWVDEQHPQGLDKEKPISLRASNISALKLIDKVLAKATDDGNLGGNTWQMSESGAVQIGPKVRLNKERRVEIYDINDLLMIVPDFTNAPQFDLNSVLSNSGGRGGGGGQSPFRDNQQQQGQGANGQSRFAGVQLPSREDRARAVGDLIKELVETEQWADNGGDGATLRLYQGAIIVNAPDYIHRQINGYPYWPSSHTITGSTGGHRWVSLTGSTSINKLDGLTPHAINAVTGGGALVNSGGNGPPGGGG